jgi:hypothetical protein
VSTVAWRAWQRFWFEPQETSSLALFRIAFGLVAVVWTLTLIPDLSDFFGPSGVLPDNTAYSIGQWGLLDLFNDPRVLLAVFALTLGSAIAVTVGLFTRCAAVMLWLGIVSFEHRDVLVTNSGDGVLRMFAFFCMLAPAGAALSIDRLRKSDNGDFWEFPKRSPWALRLIQIQVSVGYLAAVWDKVHTVPWTDGTAVSYALRLDDVHRLATPAFVTHSVILVNALTYGTLALEFALGILIWNRRARPWVLAMGICMHLAIDSSILVGFFSYVMLVGYLAFVPPETATKSILRARDRVVELSRKLRGSRSLRARQIAASVGDIPKATRVQWECDSESLAHDVLSPEALTEATATVGSSAGNETT